MTRRILSSARSVSYTHLDVYKRQGHNISQGFNFLCDKPDDLLKLLRGSSLFCEDDPTTTVHGPRDCFREIITAGSGLHVCVVRPASRQTHHHDCLLYTSRCV